MNLANVSARRHPPEDINVVIEIRVRGEPVKYEVDKETGAMFVGRFLDVAVVYPCNYGYIPHTLAGDGDPGDVLVSTPLPLSPPQVRTRLRRRDRCRARCASGPSLARWVASFQAVPERP